MKNETKNRIVILFEEKHSAPYFLNPGESLPTEWVKNYTIKTIRNK